MGAAHEREPEATPVGGTSLGTSDSAAGQRHRDADPLADPGDDERQPVRRRIDAGQQQDARTDEIRDRAGSEEPQPTEAVDKRPADEGRRHLDEGGQADDQPDLLVAERPARESATGSEAVKPWKPAWRANRATASRSEHRPMIAERDRA